MQLVLIALLLFTPHLMAAETCSRTAIINYQEILIDTDSTRRGEGLRYYLEKDDVALQYLDKYQEGVEMKWHSALAGTAGTGLLIAGLFTNSTSDSKSMMYIGGATLLALNFLIAKTLSTANEQNLIKAVEEYNKRNLPRIELQTPGSNAYQQTQSWGIGLSKQWSF